MPARVDEKKPVREDCGRFALRRIVWKRGVAAEGGDRAEAQAPVVGACGAFGVEHVRDVGFGEHGAFGESLVKQRVEFA